MQILMVVRFGTIDWKHDKITIRLWFIWLWQGINPIMTKWMIPHWT